MAHNRHTSDTTVNFLSVQGLYVFSGAYVRCPSVPPVRVGGDIGDFSRGSKRRLRRSVRSTSVDYKRFLTLTFPSTVRDPAFAYRCFRAFVKRLFRMWKKVGVGQGALIWVREFTKTGTPHYHCVVSAFIPRAWLARAWYECCGKLCPEHRAAGTRIERLRGGRRAVSKYFSKYLSSKVGSKSFQQRLPADFRQNRLGRGSAGRWWGCCGEQAFLVASLSESVGLPFRENCAAGLEVAKNGLEAAVSAGSAVISEASFCSVYEFQSVPAASSFLELVLGVSSYIFEQFSRRWRESFRLPPRHTLNYRHEESSTWNLITLPKWYKPPLRSLRNSPSGSIVCAT